MPAPSLIDNDKTEYGDITSTELFAAIADNLNYLMDACPIGSIVPILVGLGAVPTPDPTIWQLCNGSPITQPTSPLVGQSTPNLNDRYLKGAESISTAGQFGGASYFSFSHNHGGSTGNSFPGGNVDADDSDAIWEATEFHTHAVALDGANFNIHPMRFIVNFYLKIR